MSVMVTSVVVVNVMSVFSSVVNVMSVVVSSVGSVVVTSVVAVEKFPHVKKIAGLKKENDFFQNVYVEDYLLYLL